jgi:signal transduction histidine kinase
MALGGARGDDGWMNTLVAKRPWWRPYMGWGIWLAPVMALSLTLWGVRYSTIAVVLLAASISYIAPAVAADLLPIALINLGVQWIIGAVNLAHAHVAASSASMTGSTGVGGLVTTYQSIASQTNNSADGVRFTISSSPVIFPVSVADVTTVVVIDATAGAVLVLFALWLIPRTVGVHTGLVRRNSELSTRVQKLTVTRVEAVDTAARELRRVERDLHDGAQARLVALGIALRATEGLIKTNPDAALALVIEARHSSARALSELRDLVRGINPPVLAERGLGDAIRALALDAQVATTVEIDLPGRPPAPVESAVYFAVTEVLANAAKHADAGSVHIRLAHSADMLRVEVSDNGSGGADPDLGTGLRGVERRLGTFDGVLAVSSPPGGPTIVVIEVPCALSSQKTYTY